MTFSGVFMLVQLNKCVVVCGSGLQRGHGIVMMGVCLRRFCLNMSIVGDIVCSELGQGTTGFYVECSFGVMYGEWYGVCDFVVLSVEYVCVDYGGVNVFHVCLDFGIVYGVGVCVNVCGVVCVVVCCLFLTCRCCLLCCDVMQSVGVWGVVSFVLSVMRVVGGVPL